MKHQSFKHYFAPGDSSTVPSTPSVKRAYRIVVLGSTQTGKTAIVRRFLENKFTDSYTPTIEDFHRKLYRIRGDFYQLDILDTSGNDPFPAARRLSLMTGDLFLLVYSVDNRDSYKEIFELRDQIIKSKSDLLRMDFKNLNIPLVIVANKCDLPAPQHKVSADEARAEFLLFSSSTFIECSAKLGHCVDEVFTRLFIMAKLPKELSPHLKKKLLINGSMDSEMGECLLRGKSPLVRLRTKRSDPTIEVRNEEVARRPSLRTDLLLLRTKASGSDLILAANEANGSGARGVGGMKQRCSIQ